MFSVTLFFVRFKQNNRNTITIKSVVQDFGKINNCDSLALLNHL